jgi:hypothetical protein
MRSFWIGLMWITFTGTFAACGDGGSEKPGHDGGSDEVDAAPPDADTRCASNAECEAEDPTRPLCADDGACVACLTNADCDADEALPTCDSATRTCRPCVVAEDCDSEACNGDSGTCYATTDVWYVDDDGACATADGSVDNPFCTIEEAQAAFAAEQRLFIRVRGGSYGPIVTDANTNPTFWGAADALLGESPASACVELLANATLVVRGFRYQDCTIGARAHASPFKTLMLFEADIVGGITGLSCEQASCFVSGSHIAGTQIGLRCSMEGRCQIQDTVIEQTTQDGIIGSVDAVVEVSRTTIRDTGRSGISSTLANLVVTDSLIQHTGLDQMADGIACGGGTGTCTVQRSRIRSASRSGINITGLDEFTIENNAIVECGTIDPSLPISGGVHISSAGTPAGSRRFANNTIYGNKADPSTTAGVWCADGLDTIANSIVWGNVGAAQIEGCTAIASDIDQDSVPGSMNFRMDPMITSTTPGLIDEHLLPGSPCVDAGDAATAAPDDIDGEPRGATIPDVGADERM